MTERSPSEPGAPETVRGSVRWTTLPNALSVLRVVLLVPILILLDSPEPGSDGWAIGLLLVAGLTDLLDGFLARSRGSVSPTGKIADPLADKILIGGLVLYLAMTRDFPLWLVVLVVARDLALVGGAWLFFRRRRIVFAADWSGKLTTFFLGLLILAHLVAWRAAYPPLTVAATTMLLLSYVSYGRRALRFRAEGAG